MDGRRPALAEARARLGLRQVDAADAVGVTETTWSRWERGLIAPRIRHRSRIAEVFGVDLAEVDAWLDGSATPAAWPWQGPWTGGTAATVEVASEVWRWDVHPSRRHVLAALPFLPAAFNEWLLAWSLDPGAVTRAHDGGGGRVGMADVHRVLDAVEAFGAMDNRFGGGLVRPAVVDYLHSQVAPLLRGRYSDEVGAALMTAAASMTALAGWEAYDLLQHGLAQLHYGQALRLTKVADDPLTAAWVLALLAQQAIDREEPTWAIRLARAASQAGDQADASPRVRTTLLLREARATALAVQLAETRDGHAVQRVQRLIGQAEQTMGHVSSDDNDPVWVRDLCAAEVAAEAGCAWRMIGHHRQAAANAERALAGFGTAFPRATGLNHVHRAQALLQLGELHAALDSARTALPAINGLTSRRSVALLRSFDSDLTAHRREPAVRQWRQMLRTDLRGAA